MPKVTIDTISQYTGLSRGTVSRALNNKSDISQATRQRVLDACKIFNYVPNQAARALATGRGYALAVFVCDLCTAASRGVLQGILDTARSGGYTVQLSSMLGDAEAVSQALRCAMNERIDAAFVLARLSSRSVEEFHELLGKRPFAHLHDSIASGDAWLIDEPESGGLIARHFLKAGIGGSEMLYLHDERIDPDGRRKRGFLAACEREGERPTVIDVSEREGAAADDAWATAREVLRRARAAAAADDSGALRAMLIAQQVGRVVGDDLLIIGQGNEPFAAHVRPALSSVDFGGEEIGRRATEALLQRVRGERQDGPFETRVAPRLIVRGSSGAQ